MKVSCETLLAKAREARKNSYSPYSNFAVGAALLCEDGEIYSGCNIENAAYSPTCCAERVALFSAVAGGKRKFEAIAVVSGEDECSPCGVCRQVLSEFCTKDFRVITEKDGKPQIATLESLLPNAFTLK